ncbi:oxidoreductase [Sphingobium sp. SCG-1]|uniref:phage tail protein n=1 Tax=Sphingobium sp. SCG-1 TaxID=2072936 RepID=UPI000CD69053|nr:phage tail protein [Sphingobium sp. SCG-1]AUW59428.1 oxidoreductase [Sphingobium sp. SCG-1]
MMMALGLFIFEIGTLPYQQLRRSWQWRHASSDRFGALPAAQFVGPGPETCTLSGALYPGVIGDYSSIETIKAMGNRGDAFTMASGVGEVLGDFYIRSLDLDADTFFQDGVARRADFTLNLERAA